MVRVIVIVASIGEIIVHTKACNKKYHHTPTGVALLIFYSDAGGAEKLSASTRRRDAAHSFPGKLVLRGSCCVDSGGDDHQYIYCIFSNPGVVGARLIVLSSAPSQARTAIHCLQRRKTVATKANEKNCRNTSHTICNESEV